MDILLQLQSAKKHKMIYGCIENVPASSLMSAFLELDFARDSLFALPLFEEGLSDRFYVAGFADKSFCNRAVTLSVSYDDFCRRARGLGETSSID